MKNPITGNMISLFVVEPREKGSGEWSAFNAVREDTPELYPSRIPQKPREVPKYGHVETQPHTSPIAPKPSI